MKKVGFVVLCIVVILSVTGSSFSALAARVRMSCDSLQTSANSLRDNPLVRKVLDTLFPQTLLSPFGPDSILNSSDAKARLEKKAYSFFADAVRNSAPIAYNLLSSKVSFLVDYYLYTCELNFVDVGWIKYDCLRFSVSAGSTEELYLIVGASDKFELRAARPNLFNAFVFNSDYPFQFAPFYDVRNITSTDITFPNYYYDHYASEDFKLGLDERVFAENKYNARVSFLLRSLYSVPIGQDYPIMFGDVYSDQIMVNGVKHSCYLIQVSCQQGDVYYIPCNCSGECTEILHDKICVVDGWNFRIDGIVRAHQKLVYWGTLVQWVASPLSSGTAEIL